MQRLRGFGEGNVPDLTELREVAEDLPLGINLLADKAYADDAFKSQLSLREIKLLTPIKNRKKLKCRQHKSFFKWLIDKTDSQRAGQVPSIGGLLIHCLGKLTFALFLLNFYY